MNHSFIRTRWPILLFWPAFLLRYLLLEQVHPSKHFISVFSPLDPLIPFQESFLIFYALWYFLIVGMHLYTLCREPEAFLKYSRFLLFAFTVSTVTFLAFPTCQNLRPETYPRENVLTDLVIALHRMDTNTNVCPSEHVIGAVGAYLAAMHCPTISKLGKGTLLILTILICCSTVFLKQHSVTDIAAAMPVVLVSYHFGFSNAGKTVIFQDE